MPRSSAVSVLSHRFSLISEDTPVLYPSPIFLDIYFHFISSCFSAFHGYNWIPSYCFLFFSILNDKSHLFCFCPWALAPYMLIFFFFHYFEFLLFSLDSLCSRKARSSWDAWVGQPAVWGPVRRWGCSSAPGVCALKDGVDRFTKWLSVLEEEPTCFFLMYLSLSQR